MMTKAEKKELRDRVRKTCAEKIQCADITYTWFANLDQEAKDIVAAEKAAILQRINPMRRTSDGAQTI